MGILDEALPAGTVTLLEPGGAITLEPGGAVTELFFRGTATATASCSTSPSIPMFVLDAIMCICGEIEERFRTLGVQRMDRSTDGRITVRLVSCPGTCTFNLYRRYCSKYRRVPGIQVPVHACTGFNGAGSAKVRNFKMENVK